MEPAAYARRSRLRRAVTVAAWALCLLAGTGTGMLLAAPQDAPPAAAPDARAAALEQAFGPPCPAGVPAPPIALIAPLDGLYSQFVKARCEGAAGHLKEAEQGFQAGLNVPAAVPTLWRWERLQALVLQGDHPAALQELQTLLDADPDPVLVDHVRDLVTDLAVQPGTAPPAVHTDYLETYLGHVTPTPDDYDLMLRLWELTGQSKRPGQLALRRSLALQMWRNPKDADAATRWADLAQAGGAKPLAPAGADYVVRAGRLFSLGLYDELASELEHATLPAMQAGYAKALGRLYFRALIRGNRLHHAAVQVNTTSVIRRFAFDRRQQLVWAIRVHLKAHTMGPLLKYLAELEKLSPQDPQLPTIYLEVLKYNIGRHNAVTVKYWLDRLVTRFPGTQEASDGYWAVIWNAIERRSYDEAQAGLKRAIAHSGPFDPVDQARLRYWKGRVQMLQGDAAEGHATWQAMEKRWPYGYYTAMAEWRQQGGRFAMIDGADGSDGDGTDGSTPADPADGASQAAQAADAAPTVKALWNIPPFPQALFLFCLGEDDLGTSLLRNAVAQPLSDEAVKEAEAVFHHLNRHYLQLRLLANHELDLMRHSTPDDTPLWRRAFPRPHWAVVQRFASKERLDPYFIFAIMREESRFFTSAYSHAGAKGLMQIMPSTARMIARRNGLAYDEDLLHTPKLNIPIGAIYLKHVLQRFDGNPLYAAAAYNAGPTNVRRWVRRYGRLPLDEFVERIPFGETQRYVKRVFLSYMVYTKLYR